MVPSTIFRGLQVQLYQDVNTSIDIMYLLDTMCCFFECTQKESSMDHLQELKIRFTAEVQFLVR